jgi:hypothetical protein
MKSEIINAKITKFNITYIKNLYQSSIKLDLTFNSFSATIAILAPENINNLFRITDKSCLEDIKGSIIRVKIQDKLVRELLHPLNDEYKIIYSQETE